MAYAVDLAELEKALQALTEFGVVPRITRMLEPQRGAVGSSLRGIVLAEIPAFSASGNPEVLPDLERHAGEHIGEILRLLGGGAVGNFDFVRAHAQRRAEQHFPLDATLHAYRCGHKVFSHWIRDGAAAARPGSAERIVSAVADFAIEYTNSISIILAAEYVARTRVLAEAEGDRRT